ncbi:MAG: MerR family transcriptional regulator [Sporolactobacillus sp.]|jgi:DNA-binding transcriptional MerR regulator|nr:MerR family transcriptional regulator [Sporolactobacillus sp.]MCI1881665.1 MerR family transcriptional regulator [Sporolactobacillus sp.]
MSYSIGQAAKLSGTSPYTLRYYDKEGLLPFVKRDESGRRTFTDHDLNFLSVIICLKNTGMKLAEIRNYVNLCMVGDATLKQRLRLFERQKQLVQLQIKRQAANLTKINYKINYYKTAVKVGTEAAVSGNCEIPDTPITINKALVKHETLPST